METTLSVRECLRFGWNTFTAYPLIFVAALLPIEVLWLTAEYVALPATIAGAVLGILLSGIATVLYVIVMTHLMLRMHDAPATVTYGNLLQAPHLLKLIGAGILAGIITAIGFLLLIIPGIIAIAAFAFGGYLVVDKGARPVAALKESVRLTKGYRLKVLLIFLIGFLGIALSGVFFLFGEILGNLAMIAVDLVVLPVMGLAMVYAYRLLESAKTETKIAPAATEALPA